MVTVYTILFCLFILILLLWWLHYKHEILVEFRDNVTKYDVVAYLEDGKYYPAQVIKIFYYGNIEDSSCQITVYQDDGDYTKVTSFNNIYPIKEI